MPRDLLYVGPDAWDNVEKRPHHFIRRLARDRKVLWLNPALTQEIPRWIAEPVKALKAGRAYLQTERGKVRVLWEPPDAPNVRVLSVVVPWPLGGRFPLLHEANAASVAVQVAAALQVFQLDRPIFVAAHPKAHALAKWLRMDDVVYDCMDDFSAFDGWHKGRVLDDFDRALVRSARIVTCTAKQLVERAKRDRAEAHLIPNGVDLAKFSQDVRPMPIDRPAGARVFGFVGLLADWVDLDVFEALARARPDDRIVIVGPLKASLHEQVARVKALPNVTFVGPVPYGEVPRWVASFDVCLLPFRRDQLTDAVNPIKLYEYFALGKPVLASPIPEVAQYGELIAPADGVAGLESGLALVEAELADAELAKNRALQRRAVAEQHSWDGLAGRFDALLRTLE